MIRETGERFNCRAMNQRELDIETKRAILKVSPSVVALASHTSGGSELSQGCGTLIAVEGNSCILVTSLNLLRRSNSSISKNIKVTVYTCDGISCVGEILTYDFHYNILFIKFRCDNSTTQSAKLKLLEFENDVFPNTSSRLCPSNRTTFKRDEPVVVVGRYYRSPFEVMTAVGIVSERCPMWHDCTELLVASCAITRVLPDSCAKTAGLMKKDIITKCDGNNVNNFLELWDMMFEKVGETVELEVIQNDHSFHKFNMAIDEPTLNELNSWPRHPY